MSEDSKAERPATIYDLHAPSNRRSWRRLPMVILSALRLMLDAAPRLFPFLVLLQILGGVATGLQVILVKKLLDSMLSSGQGVLPALAWLVGLGLLTLAASATTIVSFDLNRILSELVNRAVAVRLFSVVAAADLITFQRPGFHDRLERAWSAGPTRSMQVSQSLLGVCNAAASLVGVAAALLTVLPLAVPLVFVTALPTVIVSVRSGRAFHQFAWGMTAIDRQRLHLSRVLTDRQHAHEVISFGLAPFLTKRWLDLFEERLSQLRRLIWHRLLLSQAANVSSVGLLVLPVGLLTWLTLSGQMSFTAALAAATGIWFLRPGVHGLIGNVAQLYEISLYLEDYEEFVRVRERLASEQTGAEAPRGFDRLTVDDVGFSYPATDQPALEEVTLEIRRGEIVALVGENGSGKTTLAKVLSGLYRPGSGRVLWDGQDVTEFDASSLRASVAVLFQDFCQYFLSLRENIAVGDYRRANDLEAVHTAAHQAGADGFIAGLPDGYETLLGPEFEGGYDLSVGQWQRVALARAFVRDAPFVILDEPTASLDARAEYELFESARELFRGRTVLLISHRFSSVRSADRIFVLRGGRVVECGTHDALIAHGGLYAELFQLQASAYQSAGDVEDVAVKGSC